MSEEALIFTGDYWRQPSLIQEPWNERRMMKKLTTHIWSPFYWSRYAAILPNASHGVGLNYEADLLVCSKNRYLTEVEIKISKSDLAADFRKWKWKHDNKELIKAFYYAMPEKVWIESKDVNRVPGSGVVVVRDGDDYEDFEVVVPAEVNRKAKQVSPEFVANMNRLLSMRYWSAMK